MILEIYNLVDLSEIASLSAICLHDKPSATKFMTSYSLFVNN